jgi:hypothetical protein
MVRILKDIGVDIPTLAPIDEDEPPFDYEGVDSLAIITLNGLSSWLEKLERKDWTVQPWYVNFSQMVQLLRRCAWFNYLVNYR